jgi:hypothetical protein
MKNKKSNEGGRGWFACHDDEIFVQFDQQCLPGCSSNQKPWLNTSIMQPLFVFKKFYII